MISSASMMIMLLGILWIVQYILSFWQMRRYYKRIAQLRRDGLVSIGMAGSAWRRRQYAVLVVDKNNRLVHVEQLSGWTVMANLKPVPGLAGRLLSDLMDDTIKLPVSPKLLLALRNAVKHIQEANEKATAKAQARDSALSNFSTLV
jgi:glucitol operon activator protein